MSQAKQTAELLCAFREPSLTDAYHGRAVMGYHRHSQLHDGALKAFIPYLSCATREQTGDVTFHNWAAIATGESEVYLVWRAFLCKPAAVRLARTSSWVGDGGMGATVWGILTVRFPRVCRA